MPYRCVAGGCSRTLDDGVSKHKFPTDTSLASKWSKAIRVHRTDWTGPSSSSKLCSLHFTSDCYNGETIMRKKMHLEDKRLNLKEGSVPTLSPPKTSTLGQGLGGIVPSTKVDMSSGRFAFCKRQGSQV